MKRARIYYQGSVQWASACDDDTALKLVDGRIIPVAEAHWLPPMSAGATTFALGLNYADHTAELGFKPLAEPLVFLKGQNTFVGHRGVTRRPHDANQMHPECELGVIIGRPAHKVRQEHAMEYVSGYTIANDYAIREYLENYYRPNLRVKNRDATTPLGPWVVDAEDIADPQNLRMRTLINGVEAQSGSTAGMVFNIATLIEYLSEFMTLMPGDLILTGTPHGVSFVSVGDEVVCEIEGIGRLINSIAAP